MLCGPWRSTDKCQQQWQRGRRTSKREQQQEQSKAEQAAAQAVQAAAKVLVRAAATQHAEPEPAATGVLAVTAMPLTVALRAGSPAPLPPPANLPPASLEEAAATLIAQTDGVALMQLLRRQSTQAQDLMLTSMLMLSAMLMLTAPAHARSRRRPRLHLPVGLHRP